jgi:hypothetical protein
MEGEPQVILETGLEEIKGRTRRGGGIENLWESAEVEPNDFLWMMLMEVTNAIHFEVAWSYQPHVLAHSGPRI